MGACWPSGSGRRISGARDSVEARALGAAANGRPFSARRGWALLLLAAGLEPVGLPPDARSKLRRVLRERDLWAMRARFAPRAERLVLRAHTSDLARIAADPEAVRSGAGAAADAGLPARRSGRAARALRGRGRRRAAHRPVSARAQPRAAT